MTAARVVCNTVSVDRLYNEKKYDKIINSKGLFWKAFCLATSKAEFPRKDFISEPFFEPFIIEAEDCLYFGVELKTNIRVDTLRELKQIVEKIRVICEKKLKIKQSFSIFPIDLSKRRSDFKDRFLVGSSSEFLALEHYLFNYVVPNLEYFFNAIGVECKKTVIQAKPDSKIMSKQMEGFQINFVLGVHGGYSISYEPIPLREDLSKLMYSQYEKNECCDLVLKAKDGEVQMHSAILSAYGSGAFRKMINVGMKESKEKTIHLADFSVNSVKVLVKFMYLGEDAIKPEDFEEEVDLRELFVLAHTYGIESLITGVTNLFSYFATPDYVREIDELADTYGNERLQMLSKVLKS